MYSANDKTLKNKTKTCKNVRLEYYTLDAKSELKILRYACIFSSDFASQETEY